VVKCSGSKQEEALSGKGIPLVHPDGITPPMAVVGGTAWMFAREVLAYQLDLLVVDEAGQMSLLAQDLGYPVSGSDLLRLSGRNVSGVKVHLMRPCQRGQSKPEPRDREANYGSTSAASKTASP